jgi:hypothetical protein
MMPVIRFVGTIVGFAALTVLFSVRIALAVVLGAITPIVTPILALLSAGGLLVAIGFACGGHWHDALKVLCACIASSVALGIFAGIAQWVNPLAFSEPVVVTNLRD